MHLWPSLRIRDSFKRSYLSKLEFNLHRMNQAAAKATDANNGDRSSSSGSKSSDPLLSESDHRPPSKLLSLTRDVALILSCCFCCFCCGACHDEEEH